MIKYDLIIITRDYFPIGGAATNRIASYSKALARYKRVLVISYAGKMYGSATSYNKHGEFCGVDFMYVTNITKHVTPIKIIRVCDILFARLKLQFYLLFKYKSSTLVYASRSMLMALFLKVVCVCTGRRFIREISETPMYIDKTISRYIATRMYSMFDGMISMTKNIRKYFNFLPDDKFFILPMSVDQSRFSIQYKKSDSPYFFVCTGGDLERDGMLDIVNGFILFNKLYPDYRMIIAGNVADNIPYNSEVKHLISKVSTISCLGAVSSKEIPALMLMSMGMAITPHNDYKTSGFPTKLGEYMSSGRPVICSNIDSLTAEIPNNCVLFVDTNSPKQIADKMTFVVEHPYEASLVGKRGHDLAAQKFCADEYVENLIDFLQI